MYGIGVDTVAMNKFRRVVGGPQARFIDGVFTAIEKDYCSRNANPDQSFAGHFAAKEALLKAIPSLRSYGVTFCEIEIFHDNFGAPYFNIYGKLESMLRLIAVNKLFLSISHSDESAVAFVIAH